MTKRLQDDSTPIAHARDLFDTVIDDFEETSPRLSSSAPIIYSQMFESAVVKVQRNEVQSMTRKECAAIKKLEIDDSTPTIRNTEGLSYAEGALIRRQTDSQLAVLKYLDSRSVLPTSNVCERLSSKSGYAFSDRKFTLCTWRRSCFCV